jgi:hypothetical protein
MTVARNQPRAPAKFLPVRTEEAMRDDPLVRHIAEVVDDLYREHSPPRDHEYLLALIRHQIAHVRWLAEKPLHDTIKQLRGEIRQLRDGVEIEDIAQ